MCIILTFNKTKHGNDYASQKLCGITSTQPRNKDKVKYKKWKIKRGGSGYLWKKYLAILGDGKNRLSKRSQLILQNGSRGAKK